MKDRHARHRRTDADRHRRPVDGFRTRGTARFGRLVADAVAGLPGGLIAKLGEVQVEVQDVPPDDALGHREELLLGTFASTSSGPTSGGADRIVLFRRPLEARAVDKHDLVDLVQETIVQELAGHLGIDEGELDELGWS